MKLPQTLHHPKNQRSYDVRLMNETDLAALIHIEQQVQAHPWSLAQFRSSLQSSHHCVVLIDQQKILAYAVISTAADEAELLNISVAKHYQQQGIGKCLLTALLTAFDDSTQTMFLEVRQSNEPAIGLYQSLGFNEAGIRPNYYPAINNNAERENAIIMAKPLCL